MLVQTHQSQAENLKAKRLQALRTSYADRITTLAGIPPETALGRAIAAALESLPRENFVEPPPWCIVAPRGHTQTVSDDPAVLYQDVLVPLGAGRGLNNGQPSLHALCLNALAPQKGESAVHVGAGTGYYTAVLALLVGEQGRVDAYEIEPELALRAAGNLAGLSKVAVHDRSGAEAPLPACDVLYVNAAADQPLAVWLDALRPGGRLLFPLEPHGADGQMLLLTRRAESSWSARFLCRVQFVPCAGAISPGASRALRDAFRKGNWNQVKSLVRDDRPDGSCWCAGHGWWLSTR